MSDPFQAEYPGTRLNRRRKQQTNYMYRIYKASADSEEIPEVEYHNSSSRENMFDCFATQPNLLPTHEYSIIDSIADNSQYHKPFMPVEPSQEVELADDKTAVRSDDESYMIYQLNGYATVYHDLETNAQVLYLEYRQRDLEAQLKEYLNINEILQVDLNTKQDYYNEAAYNLLFTTRYLSELESRLCGLYTHAEQSYAFKYYLNDVYRDLIASQQRTDQLQESVRQENAKNTVLQYQLESANARILKISQELAVALGENEELKLQLEQENQKMQELYQIALSPVSQIYYVVRPERGIRHYDLFEDQPDLFPLHFGSNPQQILYFLDSYIAAERQDPISLPTYRQLLYAAVRYRLINCCYELGYIRDSHIQELLLYDFNDIRLSGNFYCDLAPLNEVKMKLAVGYFEQAAQLAEQGGFFGISQLICPGRYVDFENVQKNMPAEASEFMGLLRALLSQDYYQDSYDSTNVFHALGLTISLRNKLGFSEFKYRTLSLLRQNIHPQLKQVILIIAGVPCFYSAPFDFAYIKTGRSKTKESHFGQFLTKIAKEFAVPTLEDFRLTEVYEYTFARSNMLPIKPRITPYMINFQQFNDDLSEDNLVCQKQASAADVLSYMAFFPHLLPMKAAFSGISRKAAQVNKQIAKQAYFYGEVVIRNVKSLLYYRQQSGIENISSNEDNFDEFSVYETAVLPLKVTEYAVRHPQVGASMQIWTNLGRYTSNFKKELKQMTKSNSDPLFAGEQEKIALFYGKEVEIPETIDEIEENSDFVDEKSNEVSGLEMHDDYGSENSGSLDGTDGSVCKSSQFQAGCTELMHQSYEKPKDMSECDDSAKNETKYQEPELAKAAPDLPALPNFEHSAEKPGPEPEPVKMYETQYSHCTLPGPVLLYSTDENEDLFNPFAVAAPKKVSQSVRLSQPPPYPRELAHAPAPITTSNPLLEPPPLMYSTVTPKKEVKEPQNVITADTGSKLSRKWSTKLKRWVEVDYNGNEIVPQKPAVEPPPPMVVPISESFAPSQSSNGDVKRRGTGRYKASQ